MEHLFTDNCIEKTNIKKKETGKCPFKIWLKSKSVHPHSQKWKLSKFRSRLALIKKAFQILASTVIFEMSSAALARISTLSKLLQSYTDSKRTYLAVWPDWVIFKTLAIYFFLKSSPNIWWLLYYFGKITFRVKLLYFLGDLKKIWATFCPNIWSHW